ncbi:MAG: Alpha/beta hydrolase family protein [Candidatus Bathyarchaeota archaeon BA2]|nr:MAG: Alpha/beta hydrolase family protein [Candidatus Bathyarchaeota archaeon BA2]
MKEKFVRFGEYGLASVLHSPNEKASACVITCHGLYSSKDSEKYVSIGRRFCEEGLAVLRFDFRGCGESGGVFEETSLTGRIEDLELALDFVEEQGYESVGVMGSSLDGTVSILVAAKDKRIKALVTWATPCYLNELFRGEIIKGFEKLRQDVNNYDVVKAVKNMHCPILIVHGSSDEQVPLSHADVLYENANEPKDIQIIEGADHRLTNLLHREKATELTLNWFKKYL